MSAIVEFYYSGPMDAYIYDFGLPSSSKSTNEGELPSEDDKGMCGLTDLVSNCLSKTNRPAVQPQPFLRTSLFTGIPPTVNFYVKGTKVSKPNRKITSKLTWCNNSLLPIVMRHSLAASHFTVVDESLLYIGYWGRHLKSSQYKLLKPYQKPASARGTGISVTRKVKEIPAKTSLVAQHYIDRPLTINGAKFDLRLYAYCPSLEPLRIYIYEEGLVRFASVP
uniref:DM13 domain-containing protein n=1 Tax=Heterorhabditis bacteriophora TaxID=37862 RepID=A0A1I7X7F1_HETBA